METGLEEEGEEEEEFRVLSRALSSLELFRKGSGVKT